MNALVTEACVQPEKTLLRVAEKFGTPAPTFEWYEGSWQSLGKCGFDGRIRLNKDALAPHLDTLAHEFAHHLSIHRWRQAKCQGEAPNHGRDFFDALVEVVEFLYTDPNNFGWDTEGDRIEKWWAAQKPIRMSSEDLAHEVVIGFQRLAELKPYIAELWKRFEKLPRGEQIDGCTTKKEFCERRLKRAYSTVANMLSGTESRRVRPLESRGAAPEIKPGEEDWESPFKSEEEFEQFKRDPANHANRVALLSAKVFPAEVIQAANEIVRQGVRKLAAEHPDHGGTHESMVAINVAAQMLRDFVRTWTPEVKAKAA
jgi:hypothetical protein